LENNGIFKVIDPQDEEYLKERKDEYHKRAFCWTAAGLASVFVADKIAKRYSIPYATPQKYKKTAFFSKYLGAPLLSFAICQLYFCNDVHRSYNRISQKYNFSFNDYNNAMNILDKANNAGKLSELLDKGDKFDWNTVPGGKPSM